MGKAKVGIVIYSDDVATAQLDFGTPIGSAVKLIAFIEREVQCRVEPLFIRIVGPPVVDLALDQADTGDVNDWIISQNDRPERHLGTDHYHHRPNTAGAVTGEIINKFVKKLHQKPQKDTPSIAAILGGLDGEEF